MIAIVWLLLGTLGGVAFLATIRVKQELESQILAMGLVVVALIYVGFASIGNAK